MRLTRKLTIPALALGVIAGGLTIGATLPDRVGDPTPTFSLPAVLQVAADDSDPRWNCETQGNRICGTMPEPMRRAAWQAFDAAGGAEYLVVDTQARVTLTGYTITDPYAEGPPVLGTNQLGLHESGVWYIFTTG